MYSMSLLLQTMTPSFEKEYLQPKILISLVIPFACMIRCYIMLPRDWRKTRLNRRGRRKAWLTKRRSSDDDMKQDAQRRQTVSGFKNRIGERLYGMYIRYVRYKATLPLLTGKNIRSFKNKTAIQKLKSKRKTQRNLLGTYTKFLKGQFQIMYDGNSRTLGRSSVPSEMKNPQIEMKAPSIFLEASSFTIHTIVSD